MKAIAFITDSAVIDEIIRHPGIACTPERPPPPPQQEELF
jgi:hypothetical protein